MKYTKADLIADTTNEAKALKEQATAEELAKLNLQFIDPGSVRRCVYGQMTGSCRSPRASELIFNCCTRFFHTPATEKVSMDVVRSKVNSTQIEGVNSVNDFYRGRAGFLNISYFSSIETYILTPKAKIKNLISFLKGESETLSL